jgi:hypothetical protein
MKKLCLFCGLDADYAIQWGSKSDQKEYVCIDHIPNMLKKISAPEAFIVKIEKVDD